MDSEHKAWIFLNQIPEMGPARFHRLLHAAQSAQGILELSTAGLLAAEVSQDVAEAWHRAFRDPANHRWLDKELDHLAGGICQVATELDEGYPSLLRELYGRPPVLYYKGRWPLPGHRVVALVGTRRFSSYGRIIAERLAMELSAQAVTTVSGLAKGIDTFVHRAALQSGGHTVAVLGCGIGHAYPPENIDLQRRIGENGTLVSEFPYYMSPGPAHFPRRNRIISGLSKGVVVIEAGEKSGALITARYAAEQNRDVFAVPGSILSDSHAGCHRLIREGAKIVHRTSDILEELGFADSSAAPAKTVAIETPCDTLSALEKQILQLLSGDPLSVDELTLGSRHRFEQVANGLMSLELKGIIRPLPGQRYAKT